MSQRRMRPCKAWSAALELVLELVGEGSCGGPSTIGSQLRDGAQARRGCGRDAPSDVGAGEVV